MRDAYFGIFVARGPERTYKQSRIRRVYCCTLLVGVFEPVNSHGQLERLLLSPQRTLM